MRKSILLGLILALAPAAAFGQIIDSPGFFFQSEGTLTASDTNPFFGGRSMPYVEGYEWNADLDPVCDWMILETMVSDPVHAYPFYLWPNNAPTGEIPFGTHEMGFSMGLVGVWADINGSEHGQWGRGAVLLRSGIGMNHQENDGHSGLSFWMDMRGDGPWPMRFLGSTGMDEAWSGSWLGSYGPGWIYSGKGEINWYRRSLDWDLTGRFSQFRIEPITFRLGDMNLDRGVNYADVPAFIKVLRGDDHDHTRHRLADFNEDDFVDYDDLLLFIQRLLRK
jgi:hypothetical protein